MRLQKPPIKVPLDEDGNLLDDGWGKWKHDPQTGWARIDPEFKDNFEFEATLQLNEQGTSTRSSFKFEFQDISNGRTFRMFAPDFIKVVQQKDIHHGQVAGKWTFVKKGNKYGLKLVE